jgi:hypothetical protein
LVKKAGLPVTESEPKWIFININNFDKIKLFNKIFALIFLLLFIKNVFSLYLLIFIMTKYDICS